MPSNNLASAIEYDYQSLDEAFPQVDPQHAPMLSNYLVQIRQPKRRTRGGIELPDEVRNSELANTTVAKVVALGPLCFKSAKTLEEWPEGPSFAVGDFLRIPRYGGYRFSVKHKGGDEIEFVLFDHLQQLAKITGDPTRIITYL